MYLKDNSLGEDMPIVPILRAMGVQSEQEIVTMVGAEPEIVGHGGLPRGNALGIFTQEQALHFSGTKISGKPRRALAEPLRLLLPPAAASQACDTLTQVVLPQVSVRAFDFRANININGNCVPAMRATSSTARRKTVTIPLCCLQAMASEFFCHPPSKCACLHLLSKNVNLFCAHSVC